MPLPALLLPLLMSGGSLLGGLFKNKQQQEQKSSTTTDQNSFTEALSRYFSENSQSGLSRPIYDQMQGNLRDTLLQKYMDRTGSGNVDELVNENYLQGARSLNVGTNRLRQNIAETFANRGLSNSAASAVALNGAENQRVSGLVNLSSQVPMMRDQMFSQRLGEASQYLSSLPVATATDQVGQQSGQQANTQNTHTTGTSNTTGTITGGQGGGIGGGIQSLITTLSGLYGDGAFDPDGGAGRRNSGATRNSGSSGGSRGFMNPVNFQGPNWNPNLRFNFAGGGR